MLMQYIEIRFYFNSGTEQYILFRSLVKKLNMNLNISHDVLRYNAINSEYFELMGFNNLFRWTT